MYKTILLKSALQQSLGYGGQFWLTDRLRGLLLGDEIKVYVDQYSV